MIESALYTRLSAYTTLTDLVGTNIYPTIPTENTALPFLVYRVTSTEPVLTTTGAADLTKYQVDVDVWGVNLDTVLAVLTEARTALHLYQGGNIHRAILTSQSTEEADDGHHGRQQYTVWGTTATITATTDSTGIIRTGNDYVQLEACEHVLRIDCDGLTLDGDEVGANPDLTGYAQLDVTNVGAVNATGIITSQTALVGPTVAVDSVQLTGGTVLTGSGSTVAVTGGVSASLGFSGSGAGLTFLEASQVVNNNGQLSDSVLSTNVPLKNAANTFTVGNTFSPAGNSTNPLTIKAHASQLVSLTEWQNSSGTALASVSKNGKLTISNGNQYDSQLQAGSFELQTFLTNNCWLANNAYYDGQFKYRSDGYAGLIYFQDSEVQMRTAPSGTAGNVFAMNVNLKVSSDNSGTVTWGGNGNNGTSNYSGFLCKTTGNDGTLILPAAADKVPLRVQGAASQTENLQTWQNTSGSLLACVTSTGVGRFFPFYSDTTGVTRTSSGSVSSSSGGHTVAANTMAAGRTMRIYATGYYSTSASPGNATWTMNPVGGNTGAIALTASQSNKWWELDFIMTARTQFVSHGQGRLSLQTTGVTVYPIINTSALSVNWGASQTAGAILTLSGTGNSFVTTNFIIEII